MKVLVTKCFGVDSSLVRQFCLGIQADKLPDVLSTLTGSSLLTGPEGLSMKERENLKKLKALRRYRRRYGVEALLHRQLRERRQAVTEGAPQVRSYHNRTEWKHCFHSLQRSLSKIPCCSKQTCGFLLWLWHPATINWTPPFLFL